jgi:hypothetical protein
MKNITPCRLTHLFAALKIVGESESAPIRAHQWLKGREQIVVTFFSADPRLL